MTLRINHQLFYVKCFLRSSSPACLLAAVCRWSSGTWDSCLTPVTCRDTPDGCTLWKLTPGLCKSKLNFEVKRLGPVTSSSQTGRAQIDVQYSHARRHARLECTHTHTRYMCATNRLEHREMQCVFVCVCVHS